MDSNYLRMIANPYLLKKCTHDPNKNKNMNTDIDNYLYMYLEKKYNNLYLHPKLYYDIIKEIDKIIIHHISSKLVQEIIDSAINKFDN